MTTNPNVHLILVAHDAIFGRAPVENERERIANLPRVTQPNPADTCDCGAESEHTEWRNGREIGVCASCK